MLSKNAEILPIVIINWNGFEDTRECIESILNTGVDNIKIFLVDNHSDEQDIASIKKSFSENPNIEITYNSENLGFTKANNRVLETIIEQEYAYVLLLNNDTVIEKSSLQFLSDYIKSGKTNILSSKLINYNYRTILDNVGHKMLTGGEIVPVGYKKPVHKYKNSFETIGACGGAAFYPVKVLKDIGLFDEYFQTGYEDAELGLRAFLAGYKTYYEPEFKVYHKISRSRKKIIDFNYVLKTQVNVYYTYLKLVHWQVMAIYFIPWIFRMITILAASVIFVRTRLLKVQWMAFRVILFRDRKKVMAARRASKTFRRISWWKLLKKQEFYLMADIKKFYRFIIKGKRSYFEKY